MDWFFEYASTIGGSEDSASNGRGRIRKKKESKSVPKKTRLKVFELEAKKANEMREAKKSAALEKTRLFNENLASVAESRCLVASPIGDAASASVAKTNYRIWSTFSTATLSVVPPPT